MKLQVRNQIALQLLIAMTCVGCATPEPFAATANRNDSAANAVANQRGSQSPFQQLSKAFPNQTVIPASALGSPLGQQNPSAGGRLLTSLSSAKDSITEALTFQPMRIPANDPVSLSSEPPPIGADLHFHAGRIYESNQNFARAISHYEQALQTEPEDSKSMVALARTAGRTGDLPRAEALYVQAAKLQPQDAAILNDLGLCYVKQGKFDAAIEVLARAVQQSPNSVRYRNNFATILVNAGRPDAALQQMAAVHGRAVAHYNVGFLLFKRGDAKRARRYLGLALQADPQMVPARQVLAQLDGPVSGTESTRPPLPRPVPRHQWSTPTQRVGFLPQHQVPLRSLPPL